MIELADRLPKPIAYVLAGGASYGAVHAGQLRALARTDIKPDLIVGTSVGSLNGAVLAEDPEAGADRLSALWASTTRDQVFGKTTEAAINLVARRPAAMSNQPLATFISAAVSSRQFSDLAVPLVAVATDFETGDTVALAEGELVSALLASAAIPGVFPAIYRDGKTLVDGGLVANVPMALAKERGANTIIVLDCGLTVLAPSRSETIIDSLLRAAAILAAQQVRRDLEVCADRTVIYLPGPWPMKGRPDEFGRSVEYADAAYEVAKAFLDGFEPGGPGRYGYAPIDALVDPDVKPKE